VYLKIENYFLGRINENSTLNFFNHHHKIMKKPIPVAIITLITIISIGADYAFASTDGVQPEIPLTENSKISLDLQNKINLTKEYWKTLEPMPTHRQEISAAVIGNEIYVIGGSDITTSALNIVEVYNTKTDTWRTISPMPAKLHHQASSSYQGKIFVVGGLNNDWVPVNSLYIYDPQKDIWTKGADMPTARGALTAQFIDGKMYAVGGGLALPNDETEVYYPISDSWEKKTPMPTAREHLASAVIDGKMYVVGGRLMDYTHNFSNNEVYDPVTDTWAVLEDMPTPRGAVAGGSLNNSIFVLGGETQGKVFEENEQYIPNQGWISKPPMKTPRHGFAVVVVNDAIYAIGGGPEPNLSVSGINEVYSEVKVIPENSVVKKIPSPRKQINDGVEPEDVICKIDRVLMIDNSGNAACVKQPTAKILVERGWGSIN
jgi:N-acetylneuraminic acid mutarotase